MKNLKFVFLAAAAVILVGLLTFAGGHRSAHPDNRSAVYAALRGKQLNSVEVYQDRNSGVITLRGIVGSADQKALAATVAHQAALDYSINNDLKVQSAGLEDLVHAAEAMAAKDRAIERNYKALVRATPHISHTKIHYAAAKGTLYLKGSVSTAEERQQAEDLASKIPDVSHVVNRIAVEPS